jgi:hypothetical protein
MEYEKPDHALKKDEKKLHRNFVRKSGRKGTEKLNEVTAVN